jgi:hypothetical protein
MMAARRQALKAAGFLKGANQSDARLTPASSAIVFLQTHARVAPRSTALLHSLTACLDCKVCDDLLT